MRPYDHRKLERKWRRVWQREKLYRTVRADRRQKYYALDMFPYPSGEGLHVGHPKGYIATDIVSRMKRMQGYAVLHPMGWDAFGLPAENFALAHKVHPEAAVKKNIARFKEQLAGIGFDYDWSREIHTTDPNYYKWTQWIFLQMFHAGLAYRSNEPVNWCPSCRTGLANEDLENGRCERCGSVVEKRAIPQWVLRITDYADRLLAGLEKLNWPEHIKEQQRNWIGRSEGLLFTAPVKGTDLTVQTFSAHFEAFYADTFVVIAPDHSRLREIVSGAPGEKEVLAFADELVRKRLREGRAEVGEPEGIFTGRYIVDPVGNGDLPIWIANFAIADYGTGIVKASAHDERDFAFAKKYSIRLKPVLFPADPEERKKVEDLEVCYSDMKNGILSEPPAFAGKRAGGSREAIADYAEKKGVAVRTVTYKLRDWVFSRQRYWGEPIPLVFCEQCKGQVGSYKSKVSSSKFLKTSKLTDLPTSKRKLSAGELANPGWVGVPESGLPVKLPRVKFYEPTGTGESPLASIPKFVRVKCPKCGGPARRETNTMPQWAGSCWYYIAYIMRENPKSEARNPKQISKYRNLKKSKRAFERWLPVDLYVGGAEHATRHLIYARFWHKFLFDRGVVPVDEPFMRLRSTGLILAADGRKMSKRHGSVINPDDIVARYGADTLRLYEMFMGPFSDNIAWSEESIIGPRRFLEKVWRLGMRRADEVPRSGRVSSTLDADLHRAVKKVTDDIAAFRFNTAVSALMVLANALERDDAAPPAAYETLLRLLAPFAPHITEELWRRRGHEESIHTALWPMYDERKLRAETATIVVQVNGRVRATLTVRKGSPKEDVEKAALALPRIAKWVADSRIRRSIYIPDRLLNIVLEGKIDKK